MEVERDKMHLTVSFRGKHYTAEVSTDATVGMLGKQLSELVGVDFHTVRLLVRKDRGVHAPSIRPAVEPYFSAPIKGSGISSNAVLWMMGSTSKELQEVNGPLKDNRILGFEEEERRRHLQSVRGTIPRVFTPKGPYTFHGFRPLEVAFMNLNPPADMARDIMIELAMDHGITAIMNKHKWSVGVMTELAPEGYVGVSAKCVLGLNKNRGEEISLRLRTDDLQGFRKYASIKKTLLHELAHMVHDEHDENFHALDKQLNQEAIDLDWTKGNSFVLQEKNTRAPSDRDGHEPKGTRYHMATIANGQREPLAPTVNSRNESAKAALKRMATNKLASLKINEPDPDEKSDVTLVITEASRELGNKNGRMEPDPDEALQHSAEPDPDEALQHRASIHQDEPMHFKEPDPDESMHYEEPDPDESVKAHGSHQDEFREALGLHNGEIGRIQDAAFAVNESLQRAIASLRKQATPEEAAAAVATLATIVSNRMRCPDDDKYKTLRKGNARFYNTVGRFEGAVEFLRVVGFSDEVVGGESLIVSRTVDPGLSWLALCVLARK